MTLLWSIYDSYFPYKPDSKNQKSSINPDVTTQYNVFKRVPSRAYGFRNVVTGHVYSNSKTIYPEKQYCYVEIKSNGPRKVHMDLGSKTGKERVAWASWSLVSSYEISPSQFKAAKNKCQFI